MRPFVQLRLSLLKHVVIMGLSEFFCGSAKRSLHRALVRGVHLIEPIAGTHSFQFLLTLHQSVQDATENQAPKDKALSEASQQTKQQQSPFFQNVSPLGCGCDPSIGVLQNRKQFCITVWNLQPPSSVGRKLSAVLHIPAIL